VFSVWFSGLGADTDSFGSRPGAWPPPLLDAQVRVELFSGRANYALNK
jgi:hypothetical protein